MNEQELARMAQQAALDTVFPPEERKIEPAQMTPPTPEEEAYMADRPPNGYYIPNVGAFDDGEGPAAHEEFTALAAHPIPFHIGQGYDKKVAEQIMCAHCQSIVFHVGVGHCFTALRCANCGREWCQHEG